VTTHPAPEPAGVGRGPDTVPSTATRAVTDAEPDSVTTPATDAALAPGLGTGRSRYAVTQPVTHAVTAPFTGAGRDTVLAPEVGDAVAALTAAARAAWGHAGHTDADLAALVGYVVTCTAANLGGVDVLVARRPDSPAALLVGQLVAATTAQDRSGRPAAGISDDEVLGCYRTEPLRVPVDPEWFGWEHGAAARHERAVDRVWDRLSDCVDDPAAAADLDRRLRALRRRHLADLDRYVARFRREAERAATEARVTTGVELVPRDLMVPPVDEVAERVAATARARTPLPARWRTSTAAHQVRRARGLPPAAARTGADPHLDALDRS
jgi:hypothetical protein